MKNKKKGRICRQTYVFFVYISIVKVILKKVNPTIVKRTVHTVEIL